MIRLIFFAAIFSLIFFYPFWPDPDGLGIYNQVCSHGSGTDVPILTSFLLSLLPCSLLAWKVFHFCLILLILFLVDRFFSVSLMGLVGFLPVFLLTLEDDLLAFPIVLLYFVWIQSLLPQSPQRVEQPLPCRSGLFQMLGWEGVCEYFRCRSIPLVVGILLSLFLGLFVWKGSFLVLGILIAYLVHPALSLVPSIAYILYSNFNTWGGSTEVIPGYGFLAGQIGLLLVLYSAWKTKPFVWRNEYFLLISLEFLVFFQPKWGEWVFLGIIPLLMPFLRDVRVRFFSNWMLVAIIVFTIFTAFPGIEEAKVIQTAVDYQHRGEIVLNDWGVGHHFEYLGGVPSQKGGFIGFQDANDSYWLGPERIDCNTLVVSNALSFQQC